jgi:mannonate dehydratase
MILSFRWYGASDPVTLARIAQIPNLRGIVTALHELPTGELWSSNAIADRKAEIDRAGLSWEVVESLNVHEDIKLGRPTRDRHIDVYCRSLENVGQAGIPVVCYNFMPVFEWMRTQLHFELSDGSRTLRFVESDLATFDLSAGAEGLPGWAGSFSADRLAELLDAYRTVDPEALWDNLAYFLERVIPVAEANGVKMAIHPDDPPWTVFGLPRIVVDQDALARLLDLSDRPANGITFCTGSLGASPENNLQEMIRRFGDRIHFAHCRNVKVTGEREFHEVAHPSNQGDVDMLAVIKAYHEIGFSGPMRPDHGRMIWDEGGQPGYGLFDRALGAMYLQGLWEALNSPTQV